MIRKALINEYLQASAKMLEGTTPCFFGCSIIHCALPPLINHDKRSDVVIALQDMPENCARCLPLSATKEQGRARAIGQV